MKLSTVIFLLLLSLISVFAQSTPGEGGQLIITRLGLLFDDEGIKARLLAMNALVGPEEDGMQVFMPIEDDMIPPRVSVLSFSFCHVQPSEVRPQKKKKKKKKKKEEE